MKKRILSIVLVAVMLLGMLVSCSVDPQKTVEPTKNEAPSLTPSPSESETNAVPKHLEGLDFGGEEIGIIICGGELATRSITGCECDRYDSEMIRRRNYEVEKLLNVNIEVKGTVAMQSMIHHMREYFVSPDRSYDIVGVYQYFDLGLAYGQDGNSFVDYNRIAEKDMYLRPEAEYWDTGAFNTLDYEGIACWITGDLSRTWVSSMYVSCVNAEMWKQYEDEIKKITGVDGDIYDLVYSGKWTIDLWCELNELVHINQDGDASKVTPDDQHGFVAYSADSGINNLIVDGIFSGCHVTFSKVNENNEIEIDYNNDYLKQYINATEKLYTKSKSCTVTYNGNMTAMDIFAKGKTLMTVNPLAQVQLGLADMEEEYYILPPPKANEQQSDYSTTVGDSTNHFGIPNTVENVAAATATLEALGYYSREIVTSSFYDECLKGAYTGGDSDKAAKMLDYTRDKIYTDFLLVWTGYLAESVSWYLRNNIGSQDVSRDATIKQVAWKKQLQRLLEKIDNPAVLE